MYYSTYPLVNGCPVAYSVPTAYKKAMLASGPGDGASPGEGARAVPEGPELRGPGGGVRGGRVDRHARPRRCRAFTETREWALVRE